MVNLDSVSLVDGKGTITGNINMPEFYYLMVKGTRIYIPVFAEAGDIVVKANMNNPRNPIIQDRLLMKHLMHIMTRCQYLINKHLC